MVKSTDLSLDPSINKLYTVIVYHRVEVYLDEEKYGFMSLDTF